MLPIEKLRAVKHIVTHENCPDGIASAMILKNVLPTAKISFVQYETIAHKTLEPEEGMLFCDFSPHKTTVLDFKEAGALVLDHHKTQKEVVETFGENGVFADEKAEPGVCGALLAFREVWQPLMKDGYDDGVMPVSVPDATVKLIEVFATLAGIRDTWQKQDPRWRQACEQAEALTFWPIDELLSLAPDKWVQKLELGPVLFERKLRGAQKCIDNGVTFMTGKGRKVILFEGLRQTSDAAEALGDKHNFVVGFGFNSELNAPAIIYSTRSHTGFDCGAFALAHGGGGHTPAAGFRVPLRPVDPHPYALFQRLLVLYETVEEEWLKIVEARRKEKDFQPVQEYQALLKGKDIHDDYLLRLDRYQRDNLVWLLAACGYPGDLTTQVEPFTFANTGDWIGEIGLMLDCFNGVGNPNQSLADLKERVAQWKAGS